MSRIGLSLLVASHRLCRLCDDRAELEVLNGSNSYVYCARCADAALERAEITTAALSRIERGPDA